MPKSKKIMKDLARELTFTEDDNIDIIVDTAYDNFCAVSYVYGASALNPDKSNLAKALDNCISPAKPENRLYTRIKELFKPKSGEMKWQEAIYALPFEIVSAESYIGYKVPASLADMAKKKLKPLEEQLYDYKQRLIGSVEYMAKPGWITKNIIVPVIGIFYFTVYGKLVVLAEVDAQKKVH